MWPWRVEKETGGGVGRVDIEEKVYIGVSFVF